MISYFHEISEFFLYLFIFLVIFTPLERVFAAHEQSFFRKEFFTDLTFHFFQSLVWTNLTLYCMVLLKDFFSQLSGIKSIREWSEDQTVIVQIFLVMFISDLLIYWGHRLSHGIDFLWRFHKVHHSSVRLDWLAAYREHPVDNIFTRVLVNLPALFLGFSLETIASYVIFRGIWGNFIHTNTDIGLGPLKYILGSPRLHHWHHDVRYNSRCNFANLMPVMDVMFGTFYDPGHMPAKYGIEESFPRNYFLQLIAPMLPEKISASLKIKKSIDNDFIN